MKDHTEHHEHKLEVLLERYEEELEDACKYAELAEEMPGCAELFHAIGKEELSHAYYLKDKLLKIGHDFSDEHAAKWHKAARKYGWDRY